MRSPGKEGIESNSDASTNVQKSEDPLKSDELAGEKEICSNGFDEKVLEHSIVSQNATVSKDCDDLNHNKELSTFEYSSSEVIDTSVNLSCDTLDVTVENVSSEDINEPTAFMYEMHMSDCKDIIDEIVSKVSVCSESKVHFTKPSESITSLAENVKMNFKGKPVKSRKACPKIKISKSIKLIDSNNPDVLKDWYISERKDSTDSTRTEENYSNVQSEHSEVKGNKNTTDTLGISTNVENVELGECNSSGNVKTISNDSNLTLPDKTIDANLTALSENEPLLEMLIDKTVTNSFIEFKVEADTTVNDAMLEDETISPQNISSSNVSNPSSPGPKTSDMVSASESNTVPMKESSTDGEFTSSQDFVIETLEAQSEQLHESSFRIKEEPMDIDDNAPTEWMYPNIVAVKLEDEIQPEVMEPVENSVMTRRTRQSSGNKIIKTEELTSVPEQENPFGASETKAKKQKRKLEVSSQVSSQSSSVVKVVKISETPRSRRRNFNIEAVVIPFSMGWMRELVHRATEARAGKRMSDVYYFSPEGTKLRSMVEISNYLSRQSECKLKLENFTFAKELIYREPFEIERSANQKSAITTPSSSKKETPPQTSKKKLTPLSTPTKRKTPSVKAQNKKLSLSPRQSTPKLKIIKSETVGLKVQKKYASVVNLESHLNIRDERSDNNKTKTPRRTSNKTPLDNSSSETPLSKKSKVSSRELTISINEELKTIETNTSIQNQSSIIQPNVSESTSKENVIMLNESVTTSINLTKNKKNKNISTTQNRAKLKYTMPKSVESTLQRPCTHHCAVAKFQFPSVQCAICLCFFHQNCVPLLSKGLKYACKPCTLRRLEFYATQRKSDSCASTSASFCEVIPDLTDDFDVSFLFPEVNLMIQRDSVLPNIPPTELGMNFERTAFSDKSSLTGTTDLTYHNAPLSINASSRAPHLLTHLLKPTSTSNSHLMILQQNSPRLCLTNTQPQFLLRPSHQNSLTTNFIQVGSQQSSVHGSNYSYANSLIIKPVSPSSVSQTILNVSTSKGKVLLQQRTSDPISALKNLSQDICPDSMNKSYFSSPVPNKFPISRIKSRISAANSSCSSPENKLITIDDSILMRGNKNYAKTHIINPYFLTYENKTGCNSKLLTAFKSGDRNYTVHQLNSDRRQCELVSGLKNSAFSWDMDRLLISCECLSLVFKRLNACDLLKVMQVCKSWNHLASQSFLWEKISFSNLAVTNWKKCCVFAQKHGTKYMDFSGIRHHEPDTPFESLENYVTILSGVQELRFDQIPPSLLQNVTCSMPQLRKLECCFVDDAFTDPEIWYTPCEIELASLRCLGRLVRLKIGSGGGIILRRGTEYLMPYLPNLRYVSLTGFKFCSHINLENLSHQKELVSLELGDCVGVEPGIYALLGCLPKLKTLRLENGGSMNEMKLSEALMQIKGLECLELMNFKFPSSLIPVFKNFHNLLHLSVWPDTTEEGALINQNLFQAMSNCKDLNYICWGVITDGESAPKTLQMKSSNEDKGELTFKELFNKLVGLFPDGRTEIKFVARSSWKVFCSVRK